jgi:hypothetical protein
LQVDLDEWLPRPTVRTHHRRAATATPDALWSAASGVRLADSHVLGRLVRWRIPGTTAQETFEQVFRRYPFTLLDAGERYAISGLCGRIWTLARDYPRLAGAEAFADWDEPGTVRVLFAHWAHATDVGRSELVSEVRVQPVDRRAALRLRRMWAVLGRFEPLIGAEALTVSVRRAEQG